MARARALGMLADSTARRADAAIRHRFRRGAQQFVGQAGVGGPSVDRPVSEVLAAEVLDAPLGVELDMQFARDLAEGHAVGGLAGVLPALRAHRLHRAQGARAFCFGQSR